MKRLVLALPLLFGCSLSSPTSSSNNRVLYDTQSNTIINNVQYQIKDASYDNPILMLDLSIYNYTSEVVSFPATIFELTNDEGSLDPTDARILDVEPRQALKISLEYHPVQPGEYTLYPHYYFLGDGAEISIQ